jgi:hypothetical protein
LGEKACLLSTYIVLYYCFILLSSRLLKKLFCHLGNIQQCSFIERKQRKGQREEELKTTPSFKRKRLEQKMKKQKKTLPLWS